MPTSKTLIKRNTDFIAGNMSYAALVNALRKHGLTASKVIKPIVDALEATKMVIHNADNPDDSWTEQVPDHSVRLKATQMGINLLQLTKAEIPDLPDNQPTTSKELQNALKNADEIKLHEIVFSKTKDKDTSQKKN